jgi:hypothetical protein
LAFWVWFFVAEGCQIKKAGTESPTRFLAGHAQSIKKTKLVGLVKKLMEHYFFYFFSFWGLEANEIKSFGLGA